MPHFSYFNRLQALEKQEEGPCENQCHVDLELINYISFDVHRLCRLIHGTCVKRAVLVIALL